MATKDRGRNQPPAMTMGGTIPPDWRAKIDKAARMAATLHWHTGDKPETWARDGIRDKVIADAREALGEKPFEDMTTPCTAEQAARLRVEPGEMLMSTPGVFRVVIKDFDYADPVVAETIMAIVERATDDELARPVPGSL